MTNNNRNANCKRIAVPLVAIMLAAVAVLGIGYALTASVSNMGNVVVTDSVSVDLYDTDGSDRISNTIFDNVKITTGYGNDNEGTLVVESNDVPTFSNLGNDGKADLAVIDNITNVVVTATFNIKVTDETNDGYKISAMIFGHASDDRVAFEVCNKPITVVESSPAEVVIFDNVAGGTLEEVTIAMTYTPDVNNTGVVDLTDLTIKFVATPVA